MTKIFGEDQRSALLPSRRELLQGAAATLAAARVGFPGGAFAQTSGPEVIPRSRQNPKIRGFDDAEIVGDRIA
jgi:hypothetical protein